MTTQTTTVTDLVLADINSAVADGCRWDSPYFAIRRTRRVLEEQLIPRLARLLPVYADQLARDLPAASATPADLEAALLALADRAVLDRLDQRTRDLHGWRPNHAGAPIH